MNRLFALHRAFLKHGLSYSMTYSHAIVAEIAVEPGKGPPAASAVADVSIRDADMLGLDMLHSPDCCLQMSQHV